MDTIDLSKNDIHHVYHTRFFFLYQTEIKLLSMNVAITIHRISSTIIVSNHDTIILCTSSLLTTRRNHFFFIPIVKPLSRFLVPLINYTKLDDACLCSFSLEKKETAFTHVLIKNTRLIC